MKKISEEYLKPDTSKMHWDFIKAMNLVGKYRLWYKAVVEVENDKE